MHQYRMTLAMAVLGVICTWSLSADEDTTLVGPRLFEHQRLSVTMTIANPYDRAVRVKHLFSTCECFLLEMDQHVLLPYEESRAYIDTLPAAEALWVLPDGEVKVTDGFNILLKERGGAVNPPPE